MAKRKPPSEKTKAIQHFGAPPPVIRKIPMSRSTAAGRTKPYVYASKCAKRGETLTEENAWEALKWEWDGEQNKYVRKKALLCVGCAKRAIAFYKQKASGG